jgi:hypothetical protein
MMINRMKSIGRFFTKGKNFLGDLKQVRKFGKLNVKAE